MAQLERGARHASNPELRTPPDTGQSNDVDNSHVRSSLSGAIENLASHVLPSFENVDTMENNTNRMAGPYLDPAGADTTPDDPARLGLEIAAETEHDSCNRSATGDHHFTNPLVNGPPAFTADEFGQQCMQHKCCLFIDMR